MTIRTNIKLILPSIIITLIFVFSLSFLISQAINNYLIQGFYDTLKNSVYENLEYTATGDVALEEILANDYFEIFCDTSISQERLKLNTSLGSFQASDPNNRCDPNQLFIQLPATSIFSLASPYQLFSISVWDNDNNLIQAIPESEAQRLNSIKAKQQLALNWNFNSDVLNIKDTDVYRGKFQYFFVRPEKEKVLFTLPILSGNKVESLGYIAVYIKTPQTGIWDVISYLLLSLLPLGLTISLLGAFFFSRSLRRQVAELQLVAAAWAKGDFSPKAQIQSHDEIGQLGTDLNKMADQLEELIKTKARVATLETKQQLSRDLHDAAKQQLFAATMQLDAANTLFSQQPEKAKTHLNHAKDLTKMAQKELAAVIDQLGPIQMHEATFSDTILDLTNDFSTQHGIPVELTLSSNFNVTFDQEKELFRVLQESLSNIAKHSQTTSATVILSSSESDLNMVIQDNGIGFNNNQPSAGFGLHSIQQRIANINGVLSIESDPNTGTTISVKIKKDQGSGDG